MQSILAGCDLYVLRQDCIKIKYDSVIEITAWAQKHCEESLYVISVWCAIHEYRVKGLSCKEDLICEHDPETLTSETKLD